MANDGEFAPGFDGQPYMYPAPLFIRSTFLDQWPDRAPSLEGYYADRTAQSWPIKAHEAIDTNGDEEPARVMLSNPPPYCPGELLTRTALLGRTELQAQGGAMVSSIPPGKGPQSCDCNGARSRSAKTEPTSQYSGYSQCSTVASAHEASDSFSIALAIRGLSEDEMSQPGLEYEGADPGFLPEMGSDMMPNHGSAGHWKGECKPCAFMFKEGCKSGIGCTFCHLCTPGEKKRRKKEKHSMVKEMKNRCWLNTWASYMGPQM